MYYGPNEVLNARRKVVCPVCTVAADRPVMIEDGREWTAHVQTRTHRKLAGRQLKDHASSTSHQHNQHPRVKHEENLEGLQDVEHTN